MSSYLVVEGAVTAGQSKDWNFEGRTGTKHVIEMSTGSQNVPLRCSSPDVVNQAMKFFMKQGVYQLGVDLTKNGLVVTSIAPAK